jgi:hypothetical protein
MRASPPNVKPKGWGNNANKIAMKGMIKNKDDQFINPKT